MKLSIFIISLCAALQASAADTLVVLSPFTNKQTATEQVVTTLTLFQEMELGESLTVIDGTDGETITTITVPDNQEMASQQGRINNNREHIAPLHRFIKQAKQGDRAKGALNLPRVVNEIALYHRYAQDIVIIGSGEFDIEEVNQSIRDKTHIPNDSNIVLQQQASIFGVKGFEERLKGFRIHWLLTEQLKPRAYRLATQRFWHLWLDYQAAQLVTFSADKRALLNRLNSRAAALPMTHTLQVSATQVASPTSATLANTLRNGEATTHNSLFNRPLSLMAVSALNFKQKNTLTVGIRWAADGIDLDVYAMREGRDELPVFYANPDTAIARHHKDILSGNQHRHFYETITFKEPIDLCDIRIGVSHYGGQSNGVIKGTLRAEINHQVYQTDFTLHSKSGNRNSDIARILVAGGHTSHAQGFRIADIVGVNNREVCSS